MKYANLDLSHYNHYTPGHVQYWNFGDQIQMIAIEKLYKYMGIDLEDVIRIPSGFVLSNYAGEMLRLPLNICFQKSKGKDYAWLSQDITPVFLAINLQTSYLTKTMVDFFSQYQPVGCRDEFTYETLKKYGVRCYLNGCITAAVFPRRRQTKNYTKVYLIDIPDTLRKYIPSEIIENSIEMSNNFYGAIEGIVPDMDIRRFLLLRYQTFAESARLVVTSRLHIAAPCASMGIPVILVRNNCPNTFSWIERIVPTYAIQQFPDINWNVEAVDYESVKSKILRCAMTRLSGTTDPKNDMDEITHFFSERHKNEYIRNKNLFQDFVDFMNATWTKNTKLDYAVWGINDIAESLYFYIRENYPEVKLKKVYDKYNPLTFHGVQSEIPSAITLSDEIFVFVCASLAKVEAKEIFTSIGKSASLFYMPGFMDEKYNMHISE